MFQKTKKISLIAVLLFMAVFFSGCVNLTKKETATTQRTINENQGVFKSIDGGKTWVHKVNLENGDFIDGIKILNIKMDPQNNNILYLGTVSNGLYKSENGTDSWIKIVDENNILSADASINDIAIEKNNPDIIYMAVTNNGKGELLKSGDGGKKWSESYIVNESGKTVHAVEVDPISQNVVYIGTAQGGLLKSNNRGITWETVAWFDVGVEVKDILIDFRDNNGIILRTSVGILKTTDKGKTWDDLGAKIIASVPEINVVNINSITMHPTNPLVIYISYLNLVIISRDGGDSWEKLNTITPAKTAVGTIPQVKQIGLINNTVYYGAGNALYKSEDAGRTWSSYAISILGDVRYTVSDYANSDVIYVGSFYDPPPPPKRQRNPLFNF